MPNITKAKLDEMNELVERYEEELDKLNKRLAAAERGTRTFDGILDKIIMAANGMPLTSNRDGHNFAAVNHGYAYDVRMTEAEKAAIAEEERRERIVNLEARLAAVVAVCQFAKEHKS